MTLIFQGRITHIFSKFLHPNFFVVFFFSRGLAVGQISGPDYCLRRGKRYHSVNNTQSVNCTLAQCASFAEKGRVEIEKIKVEFQQKGGPISDCSQVYCSGLFVVS